MLGGKSCLFPIKLQNNGLILVVILILSALTISCSHFFFSESLPEKVPFSSAFSIDLLWSNLCELREFCGLNSLHLPSSECIGIVKRTQILIVFFLQVPSCLILQMPRFGSRYKMYDMILPNLQLDVTHIVESGMCQLNKYTIKY